MVGNRKEEVRLCTISILETAKDPLRLDWQQLPIEKPLVRPGIQTRPAQTESHRSTTCATTTVSWKQGFDYISPMSQKLTFNWK